MTKGRKPPTNNHGLVDFFVTSGFDKNSRQPVVQVELGDYTTHMAPTDARALALNIMAAAEAAISDAFIVEFLAEYAELSLEQAQQVLHIFREFSKEARQVERAVGVRQQ